MKRVPKKPKRITKAMLRKKERTARNKALAEWGRLIRSVGACEVCGATVHPKLNKDGTPKIGRKSKRPLSTILHAHHCLPKEYFPHLMLDPKCGVCLCPKHHKHGPYSAHMNAVWFSNWLRENRPEIYAWVKANMGSPK